MTSKGKAVSKRVRVGGLSRLLAFLFSEKQRAQSMSGGSSGAYRNRFSLGGLPPAWKGKRMARIMRGGR
jgi:hypothetical protein